MISKVDLHLRPSAFDDHRSLGVVEIEHDGPRLAPHGDILCRLGGRTVPARITAIRQHGDHLAHVYADAALEDALA